MTLWIDANNQLHDDADGSALSLPNWPQGMSEATPEQIAALTNPTPTQFQKIEQEILSLESTITSRRIRESILGIDGGWLKTINDQLTTLRGQL